MSYIFINALNISPILSRILAACGSVDYLIFACLAYFVIERYGRRRVMVRLPWVEFAPQQKAGDRVRRHHAFHIRLCLLRRRSLYIFQDAC